MTDKIVLVDTGYYSRINSNKNNVKYHYKSFKRNEQNTTLIVHEKTIEELKIVKPYNQTNQELAVDQIKAALKKDGLLVFGCYLDDLTRSFSQKDLFLRLNGADPHKKQQIQNTVKYWIDNPGKLPSSLEDAYKVVDTYELNLKTNIFSNIVTADGNLSHHIKLDEILSKVNAHLFPVVFLKVGIHLKAIFIYSDCLEEIVCTKSSTQGNFLCFKDEENNEFHCVAPTSSHWNDLGSFKKMYPFFYGCLLQSYFFKRLENIKRNQKGTKAFSIYVPNKKAEKKDIPIKIEPNMVPDLKVCLSLLPLVDHFLTCDLGLANLAKFLLPEHANKIEYVPQIVSTDAL